MKICASIGGLASQMVKYALYLYIKRNSSDSNIFIDTTYFRLNLVGERVPWNGYELKRVFGIDAPNISDLISDKELKRFFRYTRNYRDLVIYFLYNTNKKLPFYYSSWFEEKSKLRKWKPISKRRKYCNIVKYYLRKIQPAYKLWLRLRNNNSSSIEGLGDGRIHCIDESILSSSSDAVVYIDEFDFNSFTYFNEFKDELIKVFTFPQMNEINMTTADKMAKENSVALHVRRSDHMYDGRLLFEGDYYKKVVKILKLKEKQLVFYIFSDEVDWCRKNLQTLGISNRDNVIFVDWNMAEDSFRDMQLMTYCKYHVLNNSGFSWWGSLLCTREDKVEFAPEGYWIDVKNHLSISV